MCGGLAEAVRRESNAAVCHWFGVSPVVVTGWRRALPAPELSSTLGHRAPRNAPETILCSLVAELLGVPRVGIDDNFFELGGDSIVSIQLVSRARRAGLSITPRMVFQHQTVEALAAAAGVVAEPVPALVDADGGFRPGIARHGAVIFFTPSARRAIVRRPASR